MPPRPRFLGVLVLLAAVLLVAGCTGGPPGKPAQAAPPGPTTAESVLGDPRTIDACSLADPAALNESGHGEFGRAENAGTVSLDYCLLRVRLPEGGLAQLKVGELAPAEQQQGDPVTRNGSFDVVQDAPLPSHCARQIVFPDRTAMRVSADLLDGKPGGRLCGLADAGTRSAVAAIDQHRVEHRDYPPNSLALVDPCSVLDTADVRQVPGLERATPSGRPAAHQCQWGQADAASPRVQLVHTAGDPPAVLHGSATEEQIAGRRTVTSVVGGDPRVPLCSAETGHVPFGDDRGQVEVAMLVVAFPDGDGIDACDFARGLAERAWPQLPRT